MSIRYERFARIKDKVCVLYAGHCADYIILLKILRPVVESSLPGLHVFLACRDELMYLLKGCPKVLSRSKLKESLGDFGYVKEIEGCLRGAHPILEFLEESGIKIPVVCDHTNSPSKLCCVFPEGSFPTKSLNPKQIERCRLLAAYAGYTVQVNPEHHTIDQAGWVIGVEGAPLFEAAARGIKTSLVPTGLGTMIYQKLFPRGEILKKVI